MSSQSPFASARIRAAFPTLPKGEVVATFERYEDAQTAVDRLAKAEFPIAGLSILGSDLKSVERITGVLSWRSFALRGAGSGLWFALLFWLIFSIFGAAGVTIGFLLAVVLICVAFGMLSGLMTYGFSRKRRDFSSVMQVLATRYSVIADSEHVARARQILGFEGGTGFDADAGAGAGAASQSPWSRERNARAAGGASQSATEKSDEGPDQASPWEKPDRQRDRPQYGEFADDHDGRGQN